MGTSLDFTTLLAIPFECQYWWLREEWYQIPICMKFRPAVVMTLLTLGTTSLYVVTNVRGGFASLSTALGMRVVCCSLKMIGSNSLLVTMGLYPLLLRTRLCWAIPWLKQALSELVLKYLKASPMTMLFPIPLG